MSSSKILIIGPSWVGDMVMAQSLFKVLKQHDPDVVIDVLAPEWSFPLLQRMPEVNRGIAMPVGHGSLQWSVRRQLANYLRDQYDQAIVLPNSLKSALIPFLAGIPVRTGWRGEMRYWLVNDIRLLDQRRYPLMIDRFVALGQKPDRPLPPSIPYPQLIVDSAQAAQLRSKFALPVGRPILALCPGAEFGPAKRWPEQHFASVATAKIAEGWQVWLLGSAKDAAVAKDIVDALPETSRQHAYVLAGKTELAEAIDLMAQADAVVSNDSGLMHIAAALGRPLVVVYGSTSPSFTPPLAERVSIESVDVKCAPCFKRECPLTEGQGRMQCLLGLLPEQVLAGLAKVTAVMAVNMVTSETNTQTNSK